MHAEDISINSMLISDRVATVWEEKNPITFQGP